MVIDVPGMEDPLASLAASPSVAPDGAVRDLQLDQLSILREFVELCEKHGLRYYLAYGTLLGAVRHHGFIPWDDDIDVTMPREDYERMAKLCHSELGPALRWQSYTADEHYPYLFGKLLKTETVLRQAHSRHLPFQQAVCIDVFPLDGGAEGWSNVVLQRVVIRVCRFRLAARIKRAPVKHVLAQLTRVIPRRLVVAAFEAMARRWPAHRSKRLVCVGGPYGYRRQSMPNQWFGAGVPQSFEGLTVIGPICWDEYLTHVYGDYMTPPQAAARVNPHSVVEVRLGASPADAGTEGPVQ